MSRIFAPLKPQHCFVYRGFHAIKFIILRPVNNLSPVGSSKRRFPHISYQHIPFTVHDAIPCLPALNGGDLGLLPEQLSPRLCGMTAQEPYWLRSWPHSTKG